MGLCRDVSISTLSLLLLGRLPHSAPTDTRTLPEHGSVIHAQLSAPVASCRLPSLWGRREASLRTALATVPIILVTSISAVGFVMVLGQC